jgi:hypothetical protein
MNDAKSGASEIPRPNTAGFDPKQFLWDGRTWFTLDRTHWWDGYVWREGPLLDPDTSPLDPDTSPSQSGLLSSNFAGCIFGPIAFVVLIGGVMLLDSLGVPITENDFAVAAFLLPVGLLLIGILVFLSRWYVRRSHKGSPRFRAINRVGAVVLSLVVVFGVIQLAIPVGRNSLDVTDKNSLTFQVFWPRGTWDLAYFFDCGRKSTDVSISMGSMTVDTTSDAGFIVIQRLAPGLTGFSIHAAGCQWHVVAGSGAIVGTLDAAVTASLSNQATDSKIDADVQGNSEKEFPFASVTSPELLFAYDCGGQTLTSAGDPAFDLIYDNFGTHDPNHEVSGHLVRSSASNVWGMLAIRSAPLLEGSSGDYMPPPGTEELDVFTACPWHLTLGHGMAVERPATTPPA